MSFTRVRVLGFHLWTLTVAAFLVSGFAALWAGDTRPTAGSAPIYAHPSWAYDVSDDRYLVGAASNVFTGVVLSKDVGAPEVPDGDVDAGYPTTLAKVHVHDNIKGVLSGTVIVSQLGGRHTDGSVLLFEGDTLLMVGQEYLFITEASGELLLLLAPGYDHYAIDDEAGEAALLTRFGQARDNQIDPLPGA